MDQANLIREQYKSFIEKISVILIDLANALKNAGIELKQAVSELLDYEFGLSEQVFTILKWNKRNSDKLGEYEVAETESGSNNLRNA